MKNREKKKRYFEMTMEKRNARNKNSPKKIFLFLHRRASQKSPWAH
jgi:hypothetical protein